MTTAHTIRMHERDNVAIVANDGGLAAGTALPAGPVLVDRVPQGHKVALVDIAAAGPLAGGRALASLRLLSFFGPLFSPYGPQNQQGTGFLANGFGQGNMGSISGLSTVMSAGLASGEAFLLSTAALEVYEQRVGTLQVTEPSVLGVQVAYAGYFTPLTINDDAIVPIWCGGS